MLNRRQNLINGFARLCTVIPLLIGNLPAGINGLDYSADPWLYLRGGVQPSAAESLIEIIVVGDVMPGRGMAGTQGIFDHVVDELEGADLAVGNLEGVIATSPSILSKSSLYLPGGTESLLANAGFDLLSLANNHTLDGGPDNYMETIERLQMVGIQPLENAQAVVREIEGLKIAFLAWNETPPASGAGLLSALRAIRSSVDIVIILTHWGQEYQRHPNWSQRKLAADLFEAGADIILGSHPHVVQDFQIEPPGSTKDRTRLVSYSLGNFVFDQGWGDTREGLALRLFLDRKGLRAVQALPLWTAPRPRWMAPDDAASLLERILPVEREGFVCSIDTCRPVNVPQEKHDGLFWSGAIDLTGDGRSEIIRRQGHSLEIYQGGQSVWHSPLDWRVHDLALGDPNEDGRYEVMLAIEKTGLDGNSTYHPFIVGYRGGIYRVLWGGSA
ncbi:MAG: CapA family protein, partial [Anaerolineales bacterium]